MKKLLVTLPLLLGLAACSSGNRKQDKAAEIHYSYGTQELLQKNYTQAITHLLKAATLDPKNPEVHNNLGMAYYFKNDKELAIQHIKRAIELDPKNTDATVNLASLHFENNELELAEKLYLKALKDLTVEKHARTYYNLALIELRRHNVMKAQGYLASSLKEEENYCPAWLQKGIIDYKARHFKDAAKNFRKARMGLCINDPAPLYWLGSTEAELGDYLSARMKLDDVLSRFGNSPYASLAQQRLSEITIMENSRPQATSSTTPFTPSF